MFSVLFPGQGSQSVGMGKNLYEKFDYVKSRFKQADDILQKSISKIILEGPKELVDQTQNTQPAIFLVSYCIYEVIKKETSFNLNNAKFFAGHSLGEYSALACSGSLSFEQTIKLLQNRGNFMRSAVAKGQGGMLAVLGSDIKKINEIINFNEEKFKCYVANDNSIGQIVVSGNLDDLNKFSEELKKNKIKNIKLPVSAPFHCELMRSATEKMREVIIKEEFKKPEINIISNVTAQQTNDPNEIKNLLIEQIERPVRWREIVINMIDSKVEKFIEIGPGKVLSGLVKRINSNVKLIQVNNLEDLNNLI
jgi:[acyl-carrier-protein] S-malonyltransferase|tara:strand:+ start:312 stop:1235 length:924 start_codon:yes stop_codon:yes gene_type:complete